MWIVAVTFVQIHDTTNLVYPWIHGYWNSTIAMPIEPWKKYYWIHPQSERVMSHIPSPWRRRPRLRRVARMILYRHWVIGLVIPLSITMFDRTVINFVVYDPVLCYAVKVSCVLLHHRHPNGRCSDPLY